MTLKGQLQHFGLGELFQTLALNRHTGTLIVENGDEKKTIYFSTGSIALLSTGNSIRLGEILLREGKITQDDLQNAFEDQANSGKLLGRILIERGLITVDDVQLALRRKIEEELYDLFLWEAGTFEFLPDYCPPEILDPLQKQTKINIDPQAIMMEGLRQLDELKVIQSRIPDTRVVLKKLVQTPPKDSDLQRNESEVWATLPDQGMVSEILAGSPESRFRTTKILFRFVEEEWLRPLKYKEYLELAAGAQRQENDSLARQLYTYVHEAYPEADEDADFLRKAGSFLYDIAEKEKGRSLLLRAIELDRAAGRTSIAWETGFRLFRRGSRDLDLIRSLWSLHSSAPAKEAVLVRQTLVAELTKAGEFMEVEAILAELESQLAGDPEYWIQRGEALRAQGRSEDAIARFERAVDLLDKSRGLKELIRVNRMIFDLDSSRSDVRQRIQDLLKIQERKEERKRRRFTLLGALSILLLLLLIYPIRYELKARELFQKARMLEVAYADEDQYEDARNAYEAIATEYRFSTQAGLARERAGLLEHAMKDRERRARERVAREQQQVRNTLRSNEKRAAELLASARKAEAEGDYASARSRYKSLLEDYKPFIESEKILFPILIESEPTGADVSIDGKGLGKTPVTYHYPPGSSFSVDLKREGCRSRQVRFEDDGRVLLFVPLERRPLAQFWLPGGLQGGAVHTSTRLLIPCRDGWLYAFELPLSAAKEALWRHRTGIPGHPAASLELGGGYVLVSSVSGLVQKIRVDGGKDTWEFHTSTPVGSPAVASERSQFAAVAEESGRLTLLDGIRGTVLATRDLQYPAALLQFQDGELVCVDRCRRVLRFHLPDLEPAGTALLPHFAVAFTSDGGILMEDGTLLQKNGKSKSLPAPLTPVLRVNGEVRYGSRDRKWVILRGNKFESGEIGVPPTCSPYAIGDTIFIGGADGRFYCLGREAGQRWSMQVDGLVCDILEMDGDRLILLLRDGRMLFIELPK